MSQGEEKGGIYCHRTRGLYYGDAELSTTYEPFNGENNCFSYANYTGYNIPEEGGKNRLTNKEGCSFTITELEVWQIIEMVRK